MKKIIIESGVVAGIAMVMSDAASISSTDLQTVIDVKDDVHVEIGFLHSCIDDVHTFTQPEVVQVEPSNPSVSPIHFKMLWTIQERLAIAQLRKTDPVVDDFMSLVDHTKLNEVNLALQSVQSAIAYTLGQIAKTDESIDCQARLSAILSGVLT